MARFSASALVNFASFSMDCLSYDKFNTKCSLHVVYLPKTPRKKASKNSQITDQCSYYFLSRKMKRFPFVMVTVTSASYVNQSRFTFDDWLITQRKPTMNLRWLQIRWQTGRIDITNFTKIDRVWPLFFTKTK